MAVSGATASAIGNSSLAGQRRRCCGGCHITGLTNLWLDAAATTLEELWLHHSYDMTATEVDAPGLRELTIVVSGLPTRSCRWRTPWLPRPPSLHLRPGMVVEKGR
ncbi:hypothetical protein OsI_19180 [Oryza sativa Indica Group]|uniref:Uncharacterized protein n=1 Tax=Oryza sativa subsp. indica TaxID=39946 RepID=A2Y2F2_ORYSI|nr:hypothetical protein OsI_19180 [Oryza sativa Indica Group]